MTRLNLVLLIAVLASALYLVRTQYESRRLFTELDKAMGEARKLRDRARAPAGRKARAGHAAARGEAGQGAAADAHAPRRPSPSTCTLDQRPPAAAAAGQRAASERAMSRSVAYTSSPLLASKTPVWRSKFIVAGDRARLPRAGRPRRLGPGVRQRFLPEAGRGALRPHAGTARQPRPHPGPQRPAARHQRARAQHLGDPRGHGARQGQARAAGQAAGDAAGRAGQEARGRGQDLRLAQAPGRRGRGAADRRAEHQGHLPAQGIQAPVPRGRSRGARGGLHQRRGPAARKAWNSRSTRSWPAAPARAA